MNDYRIDAFDVEKVNDNLDTSKEYSEVVFYNQYDLILDIFNNKSRYIKIPYRYYHQEHLLLSEGKDNMGSYKYITGDGELISEGSLHMLENSFDEVIEIEHRALEYDIIDISGTSMNTGETVEDYLYFICDKDLTVYLERKAELLYQMFINLGLEVKGFTGIENPPGELVAEGVEKDFSFYIYLKNRESFTEKASQIIGNKIQVKGYENKVLLDKFLERIIDTNNDQRRNGEDVYMKNSKQSKSFKYLMLLLHLEKKVHIKRYNDKEFYIDLLIKNKPSKKILDKRKLKSGVRAEHLIFDFGGSSLTIYRKGYQNPYCTIPILELGLVSEGGKERKHFQTFHSLVLQLPVETDQNNRKRVEKINTIFKKKLKIEDSVIQPNNGRYELIPNIIQNRGGSDSSYNDGFDYDGMSTGGPVNTINREY